MLPLLTTSETRHAPHAELMLLYLQASLRKVNELLQPVLLSYEWPHILRLCQPFQEGQQVQKLLVSLILIP